MSSRSSVNLSDFKLIGGTIKLSERPSSSSHSSLSKRYYFSKLSTRPLSAFPRLCSGDNSQDDINSSKNGQRPYSADFVMPNPLSGKSKETLTDGSFESIYVPVDFQLPSSNLFKELLEEDIDEWRKFVTQDSFGLKGKTLSEHSIPSLVMSDTERTKPEDNSARDTKSHKDNTEEKEQIVSTEKKTEEVLKDSSKVAPSSRANLETDETKAEMQEDKYQMTPGLTSKPPLPKKQTVQTEKTDDDPIYDYFAIKYNLGGVSGAKTLREIAEKPMCEEVAEKIDEERSIDEPGKAGQLGDRKEGENREEVQNPPQSEETIADKENNNNSDAQDWLDEINIDSVHLKESETDKYLQEVRNQCKEDNLNDLPLLSEMDIDDLFKLDDIPDPGIEKEVKMDAPSKPPTTTKKDSTKTKKVVRAKTLPLKNLNTIRPLNDKKTVSGKSDKDSNTLKKLSTVKLNKVTSPRHKAHSIEENIETWVARDLDKVKRNRLEFTELINSVDELKSTTEVLDKDVPLPSSPSPDDKKQENYDDIETIIEALENQDKTSQQKIQNMKKIVTSELSNSMILNENEENLLYKKKESCSQSTRETSKFHGERDQRCDTDRSSPLDFSSGDYSGRNSSRSVSQCKHHKRLADAKDGQRTNRSQSADSGHHSDCLKSVGNYRDLLTYLDEVDKKCTETLEVAKERAHTATKLVMESSTLFDTVPKVEDLLTHTSEELSSYIIELTLRVKDKTSCISVLQNELSSLREKLLAQTKQAESNLRQKLKEQKEETEAIARRHQKFIDQLMEEKKTLARKCEELVEEMHNMEEKYVANMRAIEHRHQVEMQKMKDMQAASEKLKRERWIEGRTQKIKEMAVKSIEPEVERMEKRHQEELSNLRMVHKREIEELELRAARKMQEHSENLREQLIEDREKALAHEREVMRLRYEKMVESEERNYQDQRRRLLADHSNRLVECEEKEAQAAAEKERAIKQAQEEFEEKLQAATRRHANETKIIKETAAIEMENWKNSFRKQQSALLMEKETAIRRECKKERDMEIEVVIEKLENEANKARTQIEQTAENRIKRLKDKYEMEIKDLEMLEKDAQTKYCESRSKLLEYEEVIITLRNTIKQLEYQLTDEKLKREKLESEREEIRGQIREEYEDKVRSLEREVEELRTSADKQVEQLYSRVRVSLARKDELLAELTNDHRALKEKCLYLENMMEQQRKEYMINT
ncbi:centrosomal protein of 131 kDa isoform X2 [Harmonia axyridis]|uniref:centrosomal protein of 131 kDa isoform X2 n=1 Tax=Harmonia axyridis TaxID=115357 RepID=UPI001E27754D|nr:centrosomal protein of 131 kDa isoform X2 [Harmonia axyridis]